MEFEKGSLIDRAQRRAEPEYRVPSNEKKSLKSTSTKKSSFKSSSAGRFGISLPCSVPVFLSCVLAMSVFILDINQYIFGTFHCKMNIFNFQFLYPSNPGVEIVSNALLPHPRYYINESTDGVKVQIDEDGNSETLNVRIDEGENTEEVKVRIDDGEKTEDVPVAVTLSETLVSGTEQQSSLQQGTDSESDDDNVESLRDVKSVAIGTTPIIKASDMEEFDRNKANSADDSPLRYENSSRMNHQLAQARTQLLQQAGVEADSSNAEAAGTSGFISDWVDDDETSNSNLYLEEASPTIKTECDIFYGHWVYDETYPLYPPSSCPFVDEGFDCTNNGRPDSEYLKWRWQPYDCDMPRFNGTDMLERLRNKRLSFVGDSLGRNQWESMLCMLYHSTVNKSGVFEEYGQLISKHQSYLSFHFQEYNATVDFYRAPFLVHQGKRPADAPPYVKTTLHVDRIDNSGKKWNRSQLLVFNTGHWWTYAKTLRGHCYFARGGKVVNMEIIEAFEEGMRTWGSFLDRNVNPKTTRVFYRSFSPTHFRGGQWNTGGQCNVETTPYTNRTRNDIYHPPTEKVRIAEEVVSTLKTQVTLLNATELTDYRRDGHPSKWTQTAGTYGSGVNGSRYQDCSHWCLPGVPDTWNELLYASLVMHPNTHYDRTPRSHKSTRQHKKRTIRHVIPKSSGAKERKGEM